MKSKILGIAVIIIVAIGIVGGVVYLSQKKYASTATTETLVSKSDLEITQKYEPALADILESFSQDYAKSSLKDKSSLATQAKAKIITLTVPFQYKDLDLGLVLAMTSIEQGKVQLGEKQYAELIAPYPWLAAAKLTE